MFVGIPILTAKGKEALKSIPKDLSAFCRNVLVQIDGKRSIDEIRAILKGMERLDESLHKLIEGNYIDVSQTCLDIVKSLVQQMLGPKAPTLLKKIEDMHAKYGERCWDHLSELDKTARLFYGEEIAEDLRTNISKIIQETRK
ncbi:MAG TPA: hypothetical protein VN604_05300 [Nitrospirota bacterium]|nr:hypothetical protein [Nitrospirota bacterium]